MGKCGNSEKQHSLWYLAALLAPVTHAASVLPWTGTLLLTAAAAVLSRWSRWGSGWVLTVQKLWAAVIAGCILGWSEIYWEKMPFSEIVPIVILVLVSYTLLEKGKAERIGCVLLWPVGLLLGGVLLSGISEMHLQYIKQQSLYPEMTLLALLMIPSRAKRGRWKIFGYAMVVSVITAGVLSYRVSGSSESGILELSRSLSLFGIAERFESLVAASMTMGFYVSVSYLLEPGEKRSRSFGYGAAAILTWLSGVPLSGMAAAMGSVLVWVCLPELAGLKIFSKNGKKGIDKIDYTW